MLGESKKIRLNFWLLIVGLIVSFFTPLGILIIVVAAAISWNLWRLQKLNLKLSAIEFIIIGIYSLLFTLAGLSGIKSLLSAVLLLTAPFLSLGYVLGSLTASLIKLKVGYQIGLIAAIYIQAHWLYALYRAIRQVKNA